MDRPLQHIDHIMWDMEMPTSLVTVVGMMIFKTKIDYKELEHVIENRLLQFSKFRQKVIMKNNNPVWHDDEDFDIHAHISHVALPEPGGYEELQEMVGHLMAIPLDYSKSLWKVHLIDNYEGGCAVIWRIHHAIADGIALIRVVFSLTGTCEEDSLKEIHYLKEDSKEKGFILNRLKAQLDHVIHLGEDIYKEAAHLLKEPDLLADTLRQSWDTTKELAKLVIDKPRKDSIYKGHLGVVKKVAWSKPVPLPKIKEIGKKTNATVNDVLLAAMTGAIRLHLVKHDEDLLKPFRIICPVNIRKGDKIHVDNQIGMISLELPVHLVEPHDRIIEINRKTKQLKKSLEPAAVYTILNIAGDFLPKKLEMMAAEHIGDRIMGVLSNVPGPREPVYFAGKEVENIMFWIPQTNVLGVGMSIISYNGQVSLGVATDTNLIDDPDFIMDSFHEEFRLMCSSLLGGCEENEG
ncbi:MAG: wax ester/triacylglycerol synthase family O-acyltransferase [Bacteroidetes bacterium]|nr:wax ester/triacylglycerol synthase family O-acyltransferase [Bacteroidota bacterium]